MHIIAVMEILSQIYCIHHVLKNNKSRYWILLLLIPWVGIIFYFFSEILPGLTEDLPDAIPSDESDVSDLSEDRTLSYISQGKLYHKQNAVHAKLIQSRFGQKVIDNTIKAQQKNEWKTKGNGSHFGGSTLWGIDKLDTDAVRVNITSVAGTREKNSLYYILETDATSGLFEYDPATDEEKRLFHRENFYAKDLDINHETHQLVCSQRFSNGTSNLLLMNNDGGHPCEITQGDSIDDAPSWIAGEQHRILFQSSGIARNNHGYAVGRGPVSIQAIDLDNNRLTTVLEDNRYDFLQPHISHDGYLYYIRRPYETNEYTMGAIISDFILFPFRLVRAVFHYLNFFSLVYSKKPLTTASGPAIQGDDLKSIVLKGKIINAEKMLRQGQKVMGVPSLVPSTWQLIRRSQDNQEEIVARNVVAFDIGSDGTIIYSNGSGVFTLDARNKSSLILKDHLIEEVVIG